ncbi:replication factor A [archaeon]|nr:replication factor A [archaeon]
MADVNLGRYSTVNINPSGINLDNAIESSYSAATKKSLVEANDSEVIIVRGALVDISEEPRIFDRDSEKGVVINAIIDDGTANMRAAFYDTLAETLLDIPTQLLVNGDYHEKLGERRKKLLGKEVVVIAKVKTSDFTGKLELVARDLNLNPDPREEVKILLEKARRGENCGA